MVIVILGCILSLPCSGNHTPGSWTPASKAVRIPWAGAEQLSGVQCVSGKAQVRDLKAGRVQQDNYLHRYSCTWTFTKGEEEYCLSHERNLLILKSRAQEPQGGTRWLKKTFSTTPVTQRAALCSLWMPWIHIVVIWQNFLWRCWLIVAYVYSEGKVKVFWKTYFHWVLIKNNYFKAA